VPGRSEFGPKVRRVNEGAAREQAVPVMVCLCRKIGRIVLTLAFLLLAWAPCPAQDLVFPQGQFLHLTKTEMQSFARLNFSIPFEPAWKQDRLRLWPVRIVAADGRVWQVPLAPVNNWKANSGGLFPSIFVPPGDYTLVFTGARLAPMWSRGALSGFACANDTMGMGGNRICEANCSANATMDPVEVAIPWKATAGEHYDLEVRQIVVAPLPAVEWAGVECYYWVADALGYGAADICVTNTSARHGIDSMPVCRSIRFTLSGSSPNGKTVVVPVPAANAAPSSAVPEPAELIVSSTPPGAAIRINDNFFGKTPARLKLVAGDYTIAIDLPGYATWKRSLKLAAGSQITVDAQLAPASPPPPDSPPASPPNSAPASETPSSKTPAYAARN